ncbi:MAG: tetratricopeptide repeat protein [Saprospiraceae bacterium]
MNENNRQELIELYLQGELEGQVLHDFEQQLKADKTLQADVILSKDVQKALDGVEGEQLLTEQISSFNNKYVTQSQLLDDSTKGNNQTSNSKRNISIAALLIVAALAIFWIWQQQNTSNEIEPEQIFASYYEPYSSNQLARGDDDTDEAYLKAIEDYDNKNYNAAIVSLTQRIAAKPEEIPTQLLIGNSYLNVSPPETAKAIALFKKIAEGETIYTTSANWYLALAYLQNNELETAKAVFEDLSQNASGQFANLAKQVLSDWK